MTLAVVAGIAGIVLLWMVSGATPTPPSPRTPEERVALESRYKAALARGAKIDAIKYYRALHGTDLKHSKDAVERVMAGLA
jgi:ribosomal protein L7/L12